MSTYTFTTILGLTGQTGDDSYTPGPTGASSTVTGPTGSACTATGPTGSASAVVGPTGKASTATGPTGPACTTPGPTGAVSAVTGPTGPTSTTAGPTGKASITTGPTGSTSFVPGPTGPASNVTGPTGANSTAAGPTGTVQTTDTLVAANVNCYNIAINTLTKSSFTTGPTTLPTFTSSHIGYSYTYTTFSGATLSTSQTLLATCDVQCKSGGVWLVTYSVKVNIASGATANTVFSVLSVGGTQVGYNYQAQPATSSAALTTNLAGSYVYANSSGVDKTVTLYALIVSAATGYTVPANSQDAGDSYIRLVRIA